jgi:hypothetical protein
LCDVALAASLQPVSGSLDYQRICEVERNAGQDSLASFDSLSNKQPYPFEREHSLAIAATAAAVEIERADEVAVPALVLFLILHGHNFRLNLFVQRRSSPPG